MDKLKKWLYGFCLDYSNSFVVYLSFRTSIVISTGQHTATTIKAGMLWAQFYCLHLQDSAEGKCGKQKGQPDATDRWDQPEFSMQMVLVHAVFLLKKYC